MGNAIIFIAGVVLGGLLGSFVMAIVAVGKGGANE